MKIIVYSMPTCHTCQELKTWLRKNEIEFEEVDVSKNRAKAMEMFVKSGQEGVPVAEIDGEIIVGFDEGRLRELLKIKE